MSFVTFYLRKQEDSNANEFWDRTATIKLAKEANSSDARTRLKLTESIFTNLKKEIACIQGVNWNFVTKTATQKLENKHV